MDIIGTQTLMIHDQKTDGLWKKDIKYGLYDKAFNVPEKIPKFQAIKKSFKSKFMA